MSSKTVLVTGANGFIALHIVSQLLQSDYHVIGTVRNKAEVDKFHSDFENNRNLRGIIVEDISKLDAFDHVFQKYGNEIQIVLHVASPVHFESDDVVNDLLIPAINGTLSVLNGIRNYAPRNIEKVVITSSFAGFVSPKQMADENLIVTEEVWNDSTWDDCKTDAITAYCASKKFAEKAEWDFFEQNKDKIKVQLSVVSPGWVFGPQLFNDVVKPIMNVSSEVINKIVHSKRIEDVPFDMMGPYIDVRDTAKAHILAFEKNDCSNHRLILNEGFFTA